MTPFTFQTTPNVLFEPGAAQKALSRQPDESRGMSPPWSCSGCCGRSSPLLGRLGPKGPERAAGDEVTLKGEGVVNRSLHREQTLSRSRRFEALLLAFPPSCRVM